MGNLISLPANKLLDQFGSGKATPGSGSAASLMGLLGCQMAITVCLRSIEKSHDQKSQQQFHVLLKKLEEDIDPRLRKLFQKDNDVFSRVIELRILRDAESNAIEKRKLAREANDELERANKIIIEIIELCLRLGAHGITIFENGWSAIRGDSGAAISASIAGATTGIYVLSLNLKSLSNRVESKELMGECEAFGRRIAALQTQSFACFSVLRNEAATALQLTLPSLNPPA